MKSNAIKKWCSAFLAISVTLNNVINLIFIKHYKAEGQDRLGI